VIYFFFFFFFFALPSVWSSFPMYRMRDLDPDYDGSGGVKLPRLSIPPRADLFYTRVIGRLSP